MTWWFRKRNREAELREEIEFHLSEETEQREAEGLRSDEARWAGRRELGNVGLVQEDTRAAWGWTLVEQLAQDLRYGLRTMAKNPSFTLLAVLSLALGIGANVAIYSFMDTLLLRSLPVSDPKLLVVLNWHKPNQRMRDSVVHSGSGSSYDGPGGGMAAGIFPFPAFELFQKSSDQVFSSVFAYYPTRYVHSDGAKARASRRAASTFRAIIFAGWR